MQQVCPTAHPTFAKKGTVVRALVSKSISEEMWWTKLGQRPRRGEGDGIPPQNHPKPRRVKIILAQMGLRPLDPC